MVGIPQPLGSQFPITNPDGTPTEYFIRWAQERQIDITEAISLEQAQALIEEWAAEREIVAGDGLAGGGPLSDDVTITLDADLDDLNDVDTSTNPPSDGDGLVWNEVDQVWEPGTVGGSLAINEEGTPVVPAAAVLNFKGSGVTVTDAGGGVADIEITGGTPGSASFWVAQAVGTGVSQNVTLPVSVTSSEDILVFVNGIQYETDEYSVSGTTLTLTTNASGDSIEVRGVDFTGGGGSSGGGWETVETRVITSGSAAEIFTGMDQYEEIMIRTNLVTTSTSTFRAFQLSVDGGSSWISQYVAEASNGNYTAISDVGGHLTASSAGRNNLLWINNNIAGGLIRCVGQANTGWLTDAGNPTLSKVNAIRFFPVAGTFTGGTIYVQGRRG